MKRTLTALALVLALISPASANDIVYLECGGVVRGPLAQEGFSKLLITFDLDNHVVAEGPLRMRITHLTPTEIAFSGSGVVGTFNRVTMVGQQYDGTVQAELRRCQRTMPQF
jgi:hypothetical protein